MASTRRSDQGKALRGQEIRTGAVHPVVIRHPVTGAQAALCQRRLHHQFCRSDPRGKACPLLSRLLAAALTEDNQCRVKWEPGTVTIWDNRTTWHNALNDYHGHAREMHRITLSGEALAA